MKNESALWADIRPVLTGVGWSSQRHEDAHQSGIPDVSYGSGRVNGWCELKVTRWPARPTTCLNLRHFTEQQRSWLEARGTTGGYCFVLTGTPEWTMLHHWSHVRILDTVPAPQSLDLSIAAWQGFGVGMDLRHFLTTPIWA